MPNPVVVLPCGSASTTSTRLPRTASAAPKFDGRRAFADAAFLIDESDDATQRNSDDRENERRPYAPIVSSLSRCSSSSVRRVWRSLRSGSSVTCSNSQRNASPTRSSPLESRRGGAATNERRDDVVAADLQVRDGKRRRPRDFVVDARCETLVPVAALGQSGARDVRHAQRELTLERRRPDPPDEAPQRSRPSYPGRRRTCAGEPGVRSCRRPRSRSENVRASSGPSRRRRSHGGRSAVRPSFAACRHRAAARRGD